MDTLLIVEDEKLIRQGVRAMALRSGVPIARILDCTDGAQAMDVLRRERVDGMVTDIRMPHMDGVALVRATQSLPRPPVTVVLSGYSSFDDAVEMMRGGVRDYILKPVDRERLYAVLRRMDAEIEQNRATEPASPFVKKAPDTCQTDEKMRQALEYIQQNYHTGLSMERVSNHVRMNYTSFSTAFKAYTGRNFVTYLQGLRMEQAKRLLLTTDMKVFEIGIQVGYGDEKHFLKTYRAIHGMSPTEYRKNAAAKEDT